MTNSWKMTPFSYYFDFIGAPLFIALALTVGKFSLIPFLLGVLIWTLAEYLVHRFLFHMVYRREHWTHHISSRELIGVSSWKTGGIFVVLFLIAFVSSTLSVYAGLLAGYFAYISIHYLLHRMDIPFLTKHHDIHHDEGIEMNFGVTSPLWDIIFGTYKS